jgi:methyltransferase
MVFVLFISAVILLRISELVLSRSNENGCCRTELIEYRKGALPELSWRSIYPSLYALVAEYSLKGSDSWSPLLMTLYFLLIAFKGWVIFSLGKFWNTKIYRIPKSPLVKKGPIQIYSASKLCCSSIRTYTHSIGF